MEKNNAFDSHLMLESYPLPLPTHGECAEEVCDDGPIEADGVSSLKPAVSSTALC